MVKVKLSGDQDHDLAKRGWAVPWPSTKTRGSMQSSIYSWEPPILSGLPSEPVGPWSVVIFRTPPETGVSVPVVVDDVVAWVDVVVACVVVT